MEIKIGHKKWLLLLIAALCGCQQINEKRQTYVRDRAEDYLSSAIIAPLQVPPSLSHPVESEAYPLPEPLPSMGELQDVPLLPPGFGVLSS
jgi:uncharacterized lipoprotein